MLGVGLLAASLLGCGQTQGLAPEDPVMDEQESAVVDVMVLKGFVDGGQAPVIVDVRTSTEVARGAVPGVLHIPMDQVAARLAELEPHKEQAIYVICHSGGRSAVATEQLRSKGFKAINVLGGTQAWIAAGYPTQ